MNVTTFPYVNNCKFMTLFVKILPARARVCVCVHALVVHVHTRESKMLPYKTTSGERKKDIDNGNK